MLVVLALTSCKKEQETTLPDESDRLYALTLQLAKAYTDSITLSGDSAGAEEAFVTFNSKLDSISFSVAANTDLLLTPEENDTLFSYISSMKTKLKEKLERLGGKFEEEEPNDTIDNLNETKP